MGDDDDAGGTTIRDLGVVSTTELVTNGEFSADTDWTDYDNGTSGGSTVITGGQLKITQGSNSVWMGASQTFSIVSGASYRIKGRYTGGSGHGKIYVGSSQGATTYFDSGTLAGNAAGGNAHDLVFIASATGTAHLTLIDGQAATNIGYWDDVSVKQDDLVLNGGFDSDASGWDNWSNSLENTSQSGGKGILDASGGTCSARQDVTVVPGATYEISVTQQEVSGANGRMYMSDGANYSYAFGSFFATTTETTFTKYVVPTQTVIRLYCYNSGSDKTYYDNISLKQINGNPGTLVNTPTFSTDIP